MKTILLQGTDQQIKLFRETLSYINSMPKEVETRVYVLEPDDLGERHYSELTDEDFITLAEEQGRIYTLQGFQEAFNLEEINSAIDIIRFINQPIYQ